MKKYLGCAVSIFLFLVAATVGTGWWAAFNRNETARKKAKASATATAAVQATATSVAVVKAEDDEADRKQRHFKAVTKALPWLKYECHWSANPNTSSGAAKCIFEIRVENKTNTSFNTDDVLTMHVFVRNAADGSDVSHYVESFSPSWKAHKFGSTVIDFNYPLPDTSQYAQVYFVQGEDIPETDQRSPQATLSANFNKPRPYPFDNLARPKPSPTEVSITPLETATPNSAEATATPVSAATAAPLPLGQGRVAGVGFDLVPPSGFSFGDFGDGNRRRGWSDSDGCHFWVDHGFLGNGSAYQITSDTSSKYQAKHPDTYRVVEPVKDVMLAGRPAARLVYEITDSGVTYRCVAYRVMEGRFGWALMGRATADNFDSVLPSFEQTIASFRVVPATIPRPRRKPKSPAPAEGY